jgi:predicted dehydrogenase
MLPSLRSANGKNLHPQGKNYMDLRVGVIGCGNISDVYLTNAKLFKHIKYVACADLRHDVAQKQAHKYGLRCDTVDGLLTSSDIDIVLNLTVPTAHYDVSSRALALGKHVYTGKPLSISLL